MIDVERFGHRLCETRDHAADEQNGCVNLSALVLFFLG